MNIIATERDDSGQVTAERFIPDGSSTVWEQTYANGAPDGPPVDLAQSVPAEPAATPLDLLAQLTPDQLQRVMTLGVAVTEPAAVDTLVAAVAEGDAVTAVAVVADAAAAAQAAVEGE